VLCAQFYALRFLGLSFETTSAVLPWINLPALYLVGKKFEPGSLPGVRTWLGAGFVLIVPAAIMTATWMHQGSREYSWHVWMHSDIMYMLANGELAPEEPELAGIRLGYPWAGHVYQVLLSDQLGSPPAWNFIWTNVVWMLAIYGFAAALVAELGGNRFAQVTSVIWLFFGVNIVGYLLRHTIPLNEGMQLWGDVRYTPWFQKLLVLNQMPFALGMFIALAYFLVRDGPKGDRFGCMALTALLLSGIGLVYPIYFPPACALVGGYAVVLLRNSDYPAVRRLLRMAALGGGILIAVGITFVYVTFVTADRVGGAIQFLPSKLETVRKSIEAVVVTLPLLAGFAIAAHRLWRRQRMQTATLALGALASGLCYVVFRLPNYTNEYKFIFTTAICLAPFLSVALEPVMNRLGRLAAPLLGVVTLLLAIPTVDPTLHPRSWIISPQPRLDTSRFDLRLASGERFAKLCDAIREETRPEAILVVDSDELHLPTLTRRRLYAPPRTRKAHPGVDMTSEFVLTRVRGYNRRLFVARQQVADQLFRGESDVERDQALETVLGLGRPVVLVFQEDLNGLTTWLEEDEKARLLAEDGGLAAWLIATKATP
ncbi:MAG: hypothetical protein ACYSUI_23635, partial [Planctomycetota bacterium]